MRPSRRGRAAVVVTGAGGFLGSAVARALVRSRGASTKAGDGTRLGHVVAVLRPGGSDERLRELPDDGGWSIAHADVADPDDLGGLLQELRPRAVLHLALDRVAYEDVPAPEHDRLSVGPLETLFHGLADVPGSRLVHTSSAWVLRGGLELAESAPLDPRSPYEVNKARADLIVPELGERTGVEWIVLRPFNLFGRYESSGRLLPYLVRRLGRGEEAELSTGDQVRDFTDVADAAGAYLCALSAPATACGALYHVGSGRATTTREFALAIADVLGRRDLLRFGAVETADAGLPELVADPRRAREVLGWEPAASLEARIRETVEWWLARNEAANDRAAAAVECPGAAS